MVTEEVEYSMLRMSREAIECDCLPLCTDITYNWEISQAPADFQEFYSAHEHTYKKDPE